MKNIKKLLAFAILALGLASCGNDTPDYKKKLDVKTTPVADLTFSRYEDVLFNLDTADFQAELMRIQNDYLPFLAGDLNNTNAVKYLKDFATDEYMNLLYQKVKTAFPNLDYVKKSVEDVYAHFNYYYPEIQLPKKVFTCVTGVNSESSSVIVSDEALIVSLDWYLNLDEVYDQIGMPRYMSEHTVKETMSKDIAMQLYMAYLYEWRKQTNLSDEMVNAGKIKYFIEAMAPELPDHILLGYSEEQMKWADENEGNVWADIVGNQRLFSTGLDMHMTFLADGPFTQEYSNEAPSRLGEFLGLHIIRSYMANNEVTLPQLMKNKDFQGIFQNSNYKPKKN